MENAAKALQMAAGVLLALMIAALVVWGFRQMSRMPEQEDELLSTEQLQKFNQEFEVYDKSLMYGVDVISCLNKVQNYNNKYVLTNDPNSGKGQLKGTGFFSGTSEAGEDFKINIYLSLTTPLSETLEFYRIDPKSGKEMEILSLKESEKEIYKNIKLEDVFGKKCFGDGNNDEYTKYKDTFSIKDIFEKDVSNHNEDKKTVKLDNPKDKYIVSRDDNSGGNTCPDPINARYGNGYYSLIYKKPTDSASSDQTNTKLSRLLKLSDKLIITKKNTGNWTNINYDVLSKVIWKNAVYDLKQKQFTCQRIEYSAKTGQVNAIYFAEK